jgi:hypothetical protein
VKILGGAREYWRHEKVEIMVAEVEVLVVLHHGIAISVPADEVVSVLYGDQDDLFPQLRQEICNAGIL